ncbi:hypothetical protein [Streptomyces sp. NPDC003032]
MSESTVPSSATGSGTVLDRMPLVELPDVRTLATAQVCGEACVWCAATLTTTAVGLGEREVEAHGSLTRWAPRCCRDCGFKRIYTALLDHSQNCEQCADNLALCTVGTVLRMAMRLVR